MTHEEIKKELITLLKEEILPQEVEIREVEVPRLNEDNEDALAISFPNNNVSPTIRMTQIYEMVNYGIPIKKIAHDVVQSIKNAIKEMPEIPNFTKDYIKEHLQCAVINADENKELLKTVPHKMFQDLAIVAKCIIDKNYSITIRNNFCEQLNISKKEVLDWAMENTQKQQYKISNMLDILQSYMANMDMPEELGIYLEEANQKRPEMYVLTNVTNTDGAVAIILPDILEKAYKKIGNNFYVLPSSRHEVILLSDTEIPMTIEEMKNMVKEINLNELDPRDKLSDSVYFYNGKTKTLSLACTEMEWSLDFNKDEPERE